MVVELIFAGVCGFSVGWFVSDYLRRKLIAAQKELIDAQEGYLRQVEKTRDTACERIFALRSNCFITNERGHRVRYVNASVECRAKAEAGKERGL